MTYNIKNKKSGVLLDVIRDLNSDTYIAVGSDTAFMFIGTVKMFQDDLRLVESYYSTKPPHKFRKYFAAFKPLLERRVRDIYYRKSFNEPMLLVIILDGSETGRIWTLEEYVSKRPLLKRGVQ